MTAVPVYESDRLAVWPGLVITKFAGSRQGSAKDTVKVSEAVTAAFTVP